MKKRRQDESSSLESLLAVLETLRDTVDGGALLAQVEQGAHVRDALIAALDQAYVDFIRNAVKRYEHRAIDPALRIKAKLLARRLAALTADAPASGTHAAAAPHDATALRQHLVAMLWAASEAAARERHLHARDAIPAPAPASLDARLEPIARRLAQQLDTASGRSADNLVRLKIIDAGLERVTDPHLRDMEALRDSLRLSATELLGDQKALDDLLRQARFNAKQLAFKTAMPSDAGRLDRRTLLRHVRAETKRAERHQHPLSLAILGPDCVDGERSPGDAVGDEVIRCYMGSVTSCARAYDVIAPYRPHGLVWLLPGTAAAQGLQALRKIQRHIATQRYQHAGTWRPLPSFSGAVIRYVQEETPAAFLARAEMLAQRARKLGPGRIEYEK